MTEPEKTDHDEETEEAQQPVEIDSTQHAQVLYTYTYLHMWTFVKQREFHEGAVLIQLII